MEAKKVFKGVLISEYRSKKGTPTWLYKIVNATEAELASFKAFKGDTYTKDPLIEEDNGQLVERPMVWANQWQGDTCEFLQTAQGNIIVDNSAMMRAEAFAKNHPWLAQSVGQTVVAQIDFGFNKSMMKRGAVASQIAENAGPVDGF